MHVEWKYKDVAAEILYDFLAMHTDDTARCLVELYEDNGPEAWRQLALRYDPIGETFVIDRMDRLMNVTRCKNMTELPAAISKWERAHADFVSRSGGSSVPEEWKLPILFKMVPESEKERIRLHFRYAASDEKTYMKFSRALIEMAGERAYEHQLRKNPDDMDCSSMPASPNLKDTASEWERHQGAGANSESYIVT